ncbi:MAG: ankyrin repeat domain-containing protein [bacterium]
MENDSSFDHVSDALVDAAYQGDVKRLRKMLAAGADVNLPDFRGDYPVHGAIQTFEIDCLKILLEAGAEVNALSSFLSTPFLDACRSGLIEAMTMLLEHGADPHVRDRGGLTALHQAADSGSFEAVSLLLEQGVAIDLRDGSGVTPFLCAARSGSDTVLQVLLDRGADLTAVDAYGDNALLMAARNGQFRVAKFLVRKGLKPDFRSPANDQTPLMATAGQFDHHLLAWLIKRGAGVNDQDLEGKTPLHHLLAVTPVTLTGLRRLLTAGAQPDARDRQGETPLMVAAGAGSIPSVRLLLERGADFNAVDLRGNSPLMFAASAGMCRDTPLSNHMAPLEFPVFFGPKPTRHDHGVSARLLLEAGADAACVSKWGDSPLTWAAIYADSAMVRNLLAQGAEVNHISRKGWTPLTLAVGGEDLLEQNTFLPNPTAMSKNWLPSHMLPDWLPDGFETEPELSEDGDDPGEVRAKNRTVRVLLTAGADLETCSTAGDTPLAVAALLGSIGPGRLLLNSGAQVNPLNKIGETPLMQAAANGHLEMVRLLLQKGAEIGARNDEGNTARLIADLNGQDAVEDYLRRRETLSPVPSGH